MCSIARITPVDRLPRSTGPDTT